LNIFNGQMFKYAQILGSILRSFPLALAAEIVPKKLNEMTHSKTWFIPLALAAEIVTKKLNEMTHSKTWFINISNTC